jgi:hypothetical protein
MNQAPVQNFPHFAIIPVLRIISIRGSFPAVYHPDWDSRIGAEGFVDLLSGNRNGAAS